MPESVPRWTNGAKIIEAREAAGLSQGQLAVLIGTTKAAVSAIETGKREASVRVLSLLADALHLDRGPLIRSKDEAVVAGELLAQTAALRVVKDTRHTPSGAAA